MGPFPTIAFENYWTMWNSRDLAGVRALLDRAVADDFIFCDPLHWHVGRDALEANVRQFRSDQPDAEFVMASGFDVHHNRYRYDWHFTRRGRVLVKGFDVATVDETTGLLERIDGFFGEIPPLEVQE